MTAAIICREYGWTLEEYEAQPFDFLYTIQEMMAAEARENTKRSTQSRS